MSEIKKEINISELFGDDTLELKQYEALEIPKIKISKVLKKAIEDQNLSLRKIAKLIDEFELEEYKISYTQIARITRGENYKIDTLLKVLDILNLEIHILPKK